MLDLTATRRAAIEQRLRDDLMIWLTTVNPAGRPHTVPVWFWWDGESITIYCEPETRKIRNLRQNPAVTLALETEDDGEIVIIFEGDAELPAEPTSLGADQLFAGDHGRSLFPTGSFEARQSHRMGHRRIAPLPVPGVNRENA